MAERHYKREKVRGLSLEKEALWSSKSFSTYDQARALAPALILEKLSSTGVCHCFSGAAGD